MSNAMSKPNPTRQLRLKVMILRESDGQIYSQVVDFGLSGTCGYRDETGFHAALVIDRVKGRSIDIDTVRSRAKTLARILDIELVEDLTWHCQAWKKINCKCPECIKTGRA